jgi:hypothetical protein
MLVVVEVHMVPGSSSADLLSDEVKRETNAQVMTVAEARQVGFGGLPDLGEHVRLIAVHQRDHKWILKVMEANPIVQRFNVHHVD